MGIPQPKYHVGQKVLLGCVNEEAQDNTQCHDCLGTRKWEVRTPAGETFATECTTCRGRGVFSSWSPKPYTCILTIGSIRVDTNDVNPITYMCQETGVGSGNVWKESELYLNEDEAMRSAEVKTQDCVARRDATIARQRKEERQWRIEKPSDKK